MPVNVFEKKTRDTLYEYIYLSSLESNVARHPLFVRLHYIHQNSFTFLTYPTAHMQRHPHSLGTMHVAGTMLVHAIKNTSDYNSIMLLCEDVKTTLNNDLGEKYFESLLHATEKKGLRKLQTSEAVFLALPDISAKSDTESTTDADRLALLILLQATRIAALLHDVGHPPFSHIVEYGLQSAIGSMYSSHELVGLELADIILAEVLDTSTMYATSIVKDYPEFCDAVVHVTKRLLGASSDHPLYAFKASLLSGDFDADRLDYVRRDIQSTGMTATTYDLGRILDGIYISTRIKDAGDVGRARIAASPRILSAIETFFVARFHLYRWAIFHHDVTRRNLCMQRFVHLVLTADDLSPEIRKHRDGFRSIATDDKRRKDYKYFTDGYFVDFLWRVFDYCEGHTGHLNENETSLWYFADVVLNRNNEAIKTLWKRPDHYLEFCILATGSEKASNSAVETFNKRLAAVFEKFLESNPRQMSKELGRYLFSQEFEKIATGLMSDKATTIYVNYNASFKAGPSADFVLSSEGSPSTISVEAISPLVGALSTAWNKSPQLMVFFRNSNWSASPIAVKDRMKRELFSALKDAIEEIEKKYAMMRSQ